MLLAAACLPLFTTDFQLFRVTGILIYAIALLGVNVLVGYNGQISLGHGAFYALGAYAAAIQIAHFGVPHWAAVPIAGALCLGVAGALAAIALQYVAPGLFGIFLSFGFLIGAMVGGVAALAGALYGALFLQLIFLAVGATARSLQTAQIFLIYGLALVVVVLFLPGGVAGFVTSTARRLRGRA